MGYTFGIGTYDVTLTQYTAFLNAVAQTDTYSLYNASMATDTGIAGISRTGVSGSYSYTVLGDGQRPVTYVSWLDAARFCNWLNNGQPQTHLENLSTTEDGAYFLNGDTCIGLETKNLVANWWIPSENEWYKAAYYDPSLNGGLGGYWKYATRSNILPGNSWANRTLANEANYYGYFQGTGHTLPGTPGGYLTPVGAFANSASAYGTYDQAGNVWNWSSSRGIHGGSWYDNSNGLASSYRYSGYDPTFEYHTLGFRVATAPEPNSLTLIVLGSVILASLRRKSSFP